jgi:arylsulfatase A
LPEVGKVNWESVFDTWSMSVIIRLLRLLSLVLLCTSSWPSLMAQEVDSDRPNIVLIMADDMGYGDPRCFNPDSRIPTPNIDRLARQGMLFTDAHSPASVCVPTRYGLLTGRYPFRSERSEQVESRIEPGRMTLASMLAKQGYVTACLGKWHQGFDGGKVRQDYELPLAGGPVDRGFDYFYGLPASLDIPPYYWVENDHCVAAPTETIEDNFSDGWTRIQGAFWRAGNIAPQFRHVDVLPQLRQRAVDYLKQHQKNNSEKPLFLYLPLPAPHTPWLPTRRYQGKSRAGEYGDFTFQVDSVVGEVLKTIKELGMYDNTLVIFTSDNGPVWYPADVEKFDHRSTGALRGMKGDAWEGGHRMPFVVRWPGNVRAGGRCPQMICHTDLMATLAEVLEIELPENAGEDSLSFLPLLKDPERVEPTRTTLVTQSSGRVLALRDGNWKLIPQLGSGGFTKPRREEPVANGPKGQLYRLDSDLSESTNLWLDERKQVARMTKLLQEIKAGPNP